MVLLDILLSFYVYDINAKDKYGKVPLHIATTIEGNEGAIIRVLTSNESSFCKMNHNAANTSSSTIVSKKVAL